MNSKIHLSIVTPAYKCEDCIEELHRRLTAVLPKLTDSYAIIFVEDGSPQKDWEVISRLCFVEPNRFSSISGPIRSISMKTSPHGRRGAAQGVNAFYKGRALGSIGHLGT